MDDRRSIRQSRLGVVHPHSKVQGVLPKELFRAASFRSQLVHQCRNPHKQNAKEGFARKEELQSELVLRKK